MMKTKLPILIFWMSFIVNDNLLGQYGHELKKIIEEHSIPIKAIHPDSTDFSDLEFLKEVIKEKRIVFLGEYSHANSASIEAEVRIIKFLHQRMGFEVLVLESNIYEMYKCWEFIYKDVHRDLSLLEGFRIFLFHNESSLHIAHYLKEALIKNSPLEVAGTDINYHNGFSIFLEKELQGIFEVIDRRRIQKKEWDEYFRMHKMLVWEEYKFLKDVPKKKFINYTETLIDQLEENLNNPLIDRRQASIMVQVLKNDLGLVKWIRFAPKKKDLNNLSGYNALRDKQMADNLMFLIGEYFKNKKIIVNVSNYHISRNVPLKKGIRPMGHYVWEAYRDEIYSIPMVFYEGEDGYYKGTEMKEVAKSKNSIEYQFHALGYKYQFMDLKDQTKLDTFIMYPSLVEFPKKYQWKNVYDGILFINEARPNYLVPFTQEEKEEIVDKLFKGYFTGDWE